MWPLLLLEKYGCWSCAATGRGENSTNGGQGGVCAENGPVVDPDSSEVAGLSGGRCSDFIGTEAAVRYFVDLTS